MQISKKVVKPTSCYGLQPGSDLQHIVYMNPSGKGPAYSGPIR